MMAYPSMSYWDAYKLPVPFRKWFIQRFNKHQKGKDSDPSVDEPLSQAQRMKMIQKSQGFSRTETKPAPKSLKNNNFLQPMRNK